MAVDGCCAVGMPGLAAWFSAHIRITEKKTKYPWVQWQAILQSASGMFKTAQVKPETVETLAARMAKVSLAEPGGGRRSRGS